MLISTTPNVDGKRVVKYFGIVSGEAILGANIFKDLFAGIRDIVGGRSGAYEKELRKAKEIALSEMAEEAQGLGANAILSVDLDYETLGQGSGMLMVSASGTAVFNLTPAAETTAAFQVVWRNGINTHTADLILPITFDEDKRQADPVITNVEVRQEAKGYRIVGVVMNAGLESARSVIISPGEPATPTDPYRIYIVGTLDPDDASPFEVTLQADAGVTEIPIVIEYRDADGNRYTATTMVDVGGTTTALSGGEDGELPLAGIVVVVLLALGIVGAIYYSWRRK